MALLVITIKDTPAGVDVCVEQEPTVVPFQKSFTPAQNMGASALSFLRSELEASQAKTGPQLVVVGADGSIN